MTYPILTERYDEKHPSDLAICERCKRTETWDVASGDPENLCARCARCGGPITMKYVEADKCPNCGKLGFFDKVLDFCCSRPCMLQTEYAATLAERG